MRRILIIFTILCSIAMTATPASSSAPVWEVVRVEDTDRDVSASQEPSTLIVESVEGKIYITVDARTKVQVFTILGQLVASRNVQPGCVSLSLRQRGVYIIKAAGLTRRVNI